MRALVTEDGFIEVHQPNELKTLLQEAGAEGDFRIVYTPTQGNMMEHFEAVNKIVYMRRNLIYAIDEVDKHQQPMWAPPNFYELINYSRHAAIAMIGTARNPAQVSKDYTFGLSEICAFRMTEPLALKYFGTKCGPEFPEQLRTLPKYAYLRWIQDGSFITGKGWE